MEPGSALAAADGSTSGVDAAAVPSEAVEVVAVERLTSVAGVVATSFDGGVAPPVGAAAAPPEGAAAASAGALMPALGALSSPGTAPRVGAPDGAVFDVAAGV